MVSLMEQGGSKWSKLVKQLDGKKEGSDEENEESPKVAAQNIKFNFLTFLYFLWKVSYIIFVPTSFFSPRTYNSWETELIFLSFKSIKV